MLPRPYIHDVPNEKSLREQDLRTFWAGFEKFRKRELFLETEIEMKISGAYLMAYKQLVETSALERGTELILIFLYGAKLARDLQPNLSKNIPIPEVSVENDKGVFSLARGSGEPLETSFKACMPYILNPRGYTPHTSKWSHETNKNFSELADWQIVDTALLGAEEYAHELFVRLKSKRKLTRSEKQLEKIQFCKIEAEKGARAAFIQYHAIDHERHALIWKQAILNKYFPHWSMPTKEFVRQVSELRIQKLNEQRQKSWLRNLLRNK